MEEKIKTLLNTPHFQLLSIEEIYHHLSLITEDEKDECGKALENLEKNFIITHNKKQQFALLKYFNLFVGSIVIKDSGLGFLDTEFGSIKIDKSQLLSSMHGDIVMVSLLPHKKDEGIVTRIIKHQTTFLIGPIIKVKKRYFLKGELNRKIVWASVKEGNNNVGKIVKVAITKYFTYNQVEGKIIDIIGDVDTPYIDITTQILMSNVKYQFNEETLQEAKQISPNVNLKDYKNRKLLDDIIITIDGDDAKDFDDAVTLKKIENGHYLLKVCIADVSEYVKENTALDQEALQRSFSIYLPNKVIPMLPFVLSDGICSLIENEIRLVMVVEIELDENVKIINSNIYEAMIKSRHRMTYAQVNKILKNDKELQNKYVDIVDMLQMMNSLSKKLYEKRIARGAFDFNNDEVKLKLDEKGKAIDLIITTREDAEKMIEELMILANECVAQTMSYLEVPFIYRVHEEPTDDKISIFKEQMKAFNYAFSYKNKSSLPKSIQKLYSQSNQSTSQAVMQVISQNILKMMAKAKYQSQNIGHFGLASKCYTHFTSPIRRYPDLLVHRLIKQFLLNKQTTTEEPLEHYNLIVDNVSQKTSITEKVVEKLERDIENMKKCEYMEPSIGKLFQGVVSAVVNSGIYITLDNTIDGLAKFSDLPYDYYEVDLIKGYIWGKKYHHNFQIGDLVRVKLTDVSVIKRQINFKVLGKIENEK